MKKLYMKPTIEVVKVQQTYHLLAGSDFDVKKGEEVDNYDDLV